MKRRWVYTSGGNPLPEPVEVTEDPSPVARLQVVGDSYYDGLQATDGTPIDSRTKHRAYMKERGLALADDFKGEWERAAQQRANMEHSHSERMRDIVEAAHDVRSGKWKPRRYREIE